MKITKKLILLGTICLAMNCSKKDDDDEAPASSPGLKESSSETEVIMAGQLSVASLTDDSYGLLASTRQILIFTLLGGAVNDAPTKVAVNDDGTFSLNLGKTNTKLASAKTAIASSPIDKTALKKAFPSAAKYIDAMTDAELKEELTSMIEKTDQLGGPQFVIVSYIPSGDALAEAKSFQFIGLPTGGKNLMVFPASEFKGDIGLGTISGSGDDATAELKASGDYFKFGDSGITQLASVGQTLKSVKNYWINKTADGDQVNLEGQPFFAWNAKFSDIVDGGSAASAPTYGGYGMYVSLNSMTDLNFSKSCPASGSPTQSIKLIPPGDIPWVTISNDGSKTANKTITASAPFDNSSPSQQTQNGSTVCNGTGTGFYLRDDGDGDYMSNWGTGGSLAGKVPEGYFEFKLDDVSKGQFDLSAGYPVDDNGNAKVYVPRISLTKSGSNVTAVNVKFAVYNSAKSAYEDVTDVGTYKKIASSFGISVSILNGSGSDERRGSIGEGGEDITVAWNDDGSMTGAIKSAYQVPLASAYEGNEGKIFSVAYSYKIGTSNYRWEFRP